MEWVVFLRAVNVGRHNRFQPSVLAKELEKLGVINVGAVGTFVVRENVSEKTLRAAILRKLPFKCDVMICRAKEIVDLARDDPLKNERTDNDRRVFLTVMSEPLVRLPKLPIYAPNKGNWEVKIVRIKGVLALSLWRRLKENPLYPNQVIEKKFGGTTTTRSWNTNRRAAPLTVLYKAEPGQMCRLFGVVYAELSSPFPPLGARANNARSARWIEENQDRRKHRGGRVLTHETRQIRERAWIRQQLFSEF